MVPAATDERAALACAERAAAATIGVLGDNALTVILHGSLVLGGYVPGRSDIDLLVIAAGPLSPSIADALGGATLAATAGWPGHVDYRVVLRAVAAVPARRPPMEVWMEIDPRLPGRHRAHVRNPGEPDLVPELSICRAAGRSLRGAAPRSLIGDVPPAWVDEVGLAEIETWIRKGQDLRFTQMTALTACRIWRYKEERVHCSKSEAGRWALAVDPTLSAVRLALQHRERDPTTRIPLTDVCRLLSTVRAHLLPA